MSSLTYETMWRRVFLRFVLTRATFFLSFREYRLDDLFKIKNVEDIPTEELRDFCHGQSRTHAAVLTTITDYV